MGFRRVALQEFIWETVGTGELLMMALPHQLPSLAAPHTPHTLEVLKGEMTGVTGEVWQFSTPLPTISWAAPRPVPAAKLLDIRTALQTDVDNIDEPNDDPYFGGKKMAALARLALIAEEVGEEEAAARARDRVRPYIEGWLGGTNPNRLLYDQTWGGVVTTCGLADQNCDFGNGMYNDHHFHVSLRNTETKQNCRLFPLSSVRLPHLHGGGAGEGGPHLGGALEGGGAPHDQ